MTDDNTADDTEVSDEFIDTAKKIQREQHKLVDVLEEATDINRTPLSERDFKRLLYGRLNVPLTDIETTLDALDDVASLPPQEAAVRLINQKTDMPMSDIRTVLDDAEKLSEKYDDD